MNYTHEINSLGERCQCGCSPVFTDDYKCSVPECWRFCEKRYACQGWEQCHKAYCEVCGPDKTANCAACAAVVCGDCALKAECRHEGCENVYCIVCAPKWLRADGSGICVPCINSFQRVPIAQFFGALRLTAEQKDAAIADTQERVEQLTLGAFGGTG